MRKSQLIGLLLLFVLLITGLGWLTMILGVLHTEEKDQPIKLYFADNISSSHQFAIDEFNRLHKGRIEVVPVDLPFSKFSTNERKELLARSLRSKSEKLDVYAVDLIWVPRFAKWSQPLDSYFSADEKKRLLRDAMKSCVYDGALMAMPMYLDVGLLYYRKDIIRRLPDAARIERQLQESITWDELLALRNRLGYSKKPYFMFPAKDYEGLVCNLLELAVGYDPAYLKADSLRVCAPAAQASLQMMVDMVKSGATPQEATEFDEILCNTYMLDHDAVFARSWPDFIQNFRTFYPDTAKLRNLAKAPLPHFPGRKSTSVFGGWNLMVSKSSAKKDAAIEFIRFLESESIQRMLFERMGYLPAISSVYDDSVFVRGHGDLAFFRKLLHNGFHRPALPDYTKESDVLSHFAHRAIKRELSVADALAKTDSMIRTHQAVIK